MPEFIGTAIVEFKVTTYAEKYAFPKLKNALESLRQLGITCEITMMPVFLTASEKESINEKVREMFGDNLSDVLFADNDPNTSLDTTSPSPQEEEK